MDLSVRIFWVGFNFLMVDGFKFLGFNGFAGVMDFWVGLTFPPMSF